ncbi:hypothetical protein [Gloeobacter morelensis]|uniref:hypothetical protein n=1 Tax=Gloeobacter morelensis TaxID=2907343 RepID=UPI001E28C022|nr:hypothetical protein [Gloeobacter morelensis]UFP97189.1 hypothetical protein ISF26_24010 [Gloeobacter morelensis MG652769]
MFEPYDIHDRRRLTLHCVISLLEPLSHIGQVQGNVSNLKTLQLLDLEGAPRSCFVFSGNALRNGLLRRRGVADALNVLGLKLSPDEHHTLFAGGRLDGPSAADLDLDTQVRLVLPALSVLGTAKPAGVFGASKSQMIPGRINVGSAYLVCYESAGYVFEQFPGVLDPDVLLALSELSKAREALQHDPFSPPDPALVENYREALKRHIPYLRCRLKSWTQLVQLDQTTRRDSTNDPNLQQYLKALLPATAEAGNHMLPGMEAIASESKVTSSAKSNQMIASDRLVMAGCQLYSRWDAHVTQTEEGFIVAALVDFGQSPYLGGKGNRGNGLCRMDLWFEAHSTTPDTPASVRGRYLSLGAGTAVLSPRAQQQYARYREHLEQYRQFLAKSQDSLSLRRLLGA